MSDNQIKVHIGDYFSDNPRDRLDRVSRALQSAREKEAELSRTIEKAKEVYAVDDALDEKLKAAYERGVADGRKIGYQHGLRHDMSKVAQDDRVKAYEDGLRAGRDEMRAEFVDNYNRGRASGYQDALAERIAEGRGDTVVPRNRPLKPAAVTLSAGTYTIGGVKETVASGDVVYVTEGTPVKAYMVGKKSPETALTEHTWVDDPREPGRDKGCAVCSYDRSNWIARGCEIYCPATPEQLAEAKAWTAACHERELRAKLDKSEVMCGPRVYCQGEED